MWIFSFSQYLSLNFVLSPFLTTKGALDIVEEKKGEFCPGAKIVSQEELAKKRNDLVEEVGSFIQFTCFNPCSRMNTYSLSFDV